jgi:hypothetical protein
MRNQSLHTIQSCDIYQTTRRSNNMTDKTTTGFNSSIHLRVTNDFMPTVHKVARAKGMTASNFIRSAVIDAMQQSGVEYPAEQKRSGSKQHHAS